MTTTVQPPTIIAHRGYAKKYPENTHIAIQAALEAGVRFVEFDVQFTKDKVPVVLHDVNLKRTTGVNKRIVNLTLTDIEGIVVNEAKEHPVKFAGVGIPTLASIIDLFGHYPDAHALVEIKQEAIDALGIEKGVKLLAKTCQPIIDRCTLIAYDNLALRCSRAMGFKSIGWILTSYDEESLEKATELAPDFLICNHTKLPKDLDHLWPGPWRWAFYEVTKGKLAMELASKGALYVETMAVTELMNDKAMQPTELADA